jgi:hypothetical protein
MKTMKTSSGLSSRTIRAEATRAFAPGLVIALAMALSGNAYAAENAAADRLLTMAKAKETRAEEFRVAAAAARQKAADDELDAAAEERDARILTARALNVLKADTNKQRAFHMRHVARELALEGHRKAIEARNAEQRAAQETRNAEELTKAAAELKDQPTIASNLENDAKEQTAEAQRNTQAAAEAKSAAQLLEQRAANGWAAAEKLDPETHAQVAAPTKAPVAEKRQAK